MKVIRDDIWLCDECTIVAVNGDTSGIESDERVQDICNGLESLGPNLVPDDSDDDGRLEFSWRGCDCCDENSNKGGSLTRFAILSDDDASL